MMDICGLSDEQIRRLKKALKNAELEPAFVATETTFEISALRHVTINLKRAKILFKLIFFWI